MGLLLLCVEPPLVKGMVWQKHVPEPLFLRRMIFLLDVLALLFLVVTSRYISSAACLNPTCLHALNFVFILCSLCLGKKAVTGHRISLCLVERLLLVEQVWVLVISIVKRKLQKCTRWKPVLGNCTKLLPIFLLIRGFLSISFCWYRLMRKACAGSTLVISGGSTPMDALRSSTERKTLWSFNTGSTSHSGRFWLWFKPHRCGNPLFASLQIDVTWTLKLLQVEAALSSSNYVENIMVYADPFHNFCVALVVPARHVLEGWADKSGFKYSDFAELCELPEAKKEVQQSLAKVRLLPCTHFLKFWVV